MTVEQIIEGARCITGCLPRGLYGPSMIYLLDRILAGDGAGANLLNNLTEHWTFDGTLNGINGNNFTATAPQYGAGKVTTQAVQFDATANTVGVCTSIAPLLKFDVPVSFAFWVNANSVAITEVLLGFRSGSTFGADISHSAASMRLATGGGLFTYAASVLTAGAWSMFTCTCRGTAGQQVHLSLDNNAIQNGNLPFSPNGTPDKLVIGQLRTLTGTIFAGRLNSLSVWRNRALTAADISALWNGGAGLPYPFL